MRIQSLISTIRRKKAHLKNLYSFYIDRAFPNLLKQHFKKINLVDTVCSEDITEVRLMTSTKVYMHMVKDVASKEIVSYNVSTSPNRALVLNSFCNNLSSLSKHIRKSYLSY